MINGHDHGGCGKHSPVAIAGQKRKGAEDMEMRFDPSAGQMNQQTGKADLADGHRLASHRLAWQPPDQDHGKETACSAQQDGSIDVRMRRTDGSAPGAWRNYEGEQNPNQPLYSQQDEKQPVGAPINF